MPILNMQYIVERQERDGTKVTLEPKTALISRGPVLQVTLSIPKVIAQELVKQDMTVPEPIAGVALIDTGASTTCIDDAAAQKLGLPVIDVATIASASHAATKINIYPATIDLIGVPITVTTERALGANLSSQGLIALIGRDLLQNFTLYYNGVMGQITLSF
jgi:predicted aspartyl protease